MATANRRFLPSKEKLHVFSDGHTEPSGLLPFPSTRYANVYDFFCLASFFFAKTLFALLPGEQACVMLFFSLRPWTTRVQQTFVVSRSSVFFQHQHRRTFWATKSALTEDPRPVCVCEASLLIFQRSCGDAESSWVGISADCASLRTNSIKSRSRNRLVFCSFSCINTFPVASRMMNF